jgi:hypothetical protein
MTAIKKLFLLSAAAFMPFILFAQTAVTTVNDINWSLVPRWPNVSLFGVSAYNSSGSPWSEGESTGILKMDDNSIISNIQIDANNYGVIRLNKDMSTQWTANIDGYPIAIGMFGGKVLVISATDYSYARGISNNYFGFLIDPKTGQISSKKELYNGGDQLYQQPVFLYAPDGSFFKMVVRISNFTSSGHSPFTSREKIADEYFTTTDIKLLTFDNALNVKSDIKPALEQGYFVGGTTNKSGDVFLMTEFSQGYIRIARYENGKTAPAKVLEMPVSIDDNIMSNLEDFHLLTSKQEPAVLFFAGTYVNGARDRELAVGKFNFKDGTVNHNEQAMDKAYFKALEQSYVPFSRKFNSVDLGSKNEMKIRNVIEDDGKFVVGLSSFTIRSGNVTAGTHSSIAAYDLLINIYDSKINLQYQQIIPRFYSTFTAARLGIGMHCKNNVLYLIANSDKGLTGVRALYSQVDLKTGVITNITGIDKGDIKGYYAVDPYASCWFDTQFVLSYLQDKGFFRNSEDAHMQLLNY